MKNEERYILFVGNNCCSCNKIAQFIKENNINISSINIDQENHLLPFSLIIIPALVLDDKLIAYGSDILKHLDK